MAKKAGRKPYGYYPREPALIEVIRLKARTRKGGKQPGPWQIAAELNAEGYKSQTGRSWSGQMVKIILNRADVAGKCKRQRRKKTQLESTDYLSREEISLCRAACSDGDSLLFETLLGSGLRAAELCSLNIGDLGIWRGKSQIDVREGKGRKGRSVHIGPKLKSLLAAYLREKRPGAGSRDAAFLNSSGHRLCYWNLYYCLTQLGKKAGVDGLRPHRLRHTFGTFLYNYKLDLFYVKNQLGHSSVNTTEIYAKTPESSKTEQMKGFEESLDM